MTTTADPTNPLTLPGDVERLRTQFPQTQDLYREVCVLMFFRYGITPTANKLYQLVRKGSMSAPAEALNRFWENLRDKSRVVIAHPDLPDALKEAAAELTATLWKSAMAQADASLESFREQSRQMVDELVTARDTAVTAREHAAAALERLQAELTVSHQQLLGSREETAVALTAKTAAETRLLEMKDAIVLQHERLETARREHAIELDQLREATRLAEERFRAMETRALLEIDRERTESKKLQKALDAERAAGAAASERHRLETGVRHTELGELRQKVGVLEGTILAMTGAQAHAEQQLDAVRRELGVSIAEAAALSTETARLQQLLHQAPASTAPRRLPASRSRKPRPPKKE